MAGDGFEGITTSSGLGHGESLIVENAQSRDFIAGRVTVRATYTMASANAKRRIVSSTLALQRSGKTTNLLENQLVRLSNLCLIISSACSSEERVLSTATFLTMPPFNPVNPACFEPLRVIR